MHPLNYHCQCKCDVRWWRYYANVASIRGGDRNLDMMEMTGISLEFVKINTLGSTQNCRHFSDDILNAFHWKERAFQTNLTEVCSRWSNWQQFSIGPGKSFVSNSRQTSAWTNYHQVQRHIYAARILNMLIWPHDVVSVITCVSWYTCINEIWIMSWHITFP